MADVAASAAVAAVDVAVAVAAAAADAAAATTKPQRLNISKRLPRNRGPFFLWLMAN